MTQHPIRDEYGEIVGVATKYDYGNADSDREATELWQKAREQRLERQRRRDYLNALRREAEGYRVRIAALEQHGDQPVMRTISDPSGHCPLPWQCIALSTLGALVGPLKRDLRRIETEIEQREQELETSPVREGASVNARSRGRAK